MLKPERAEDLRSAMLRLVKLQEAAPSELKTPWEARGFDAVSAWVTKAGEQGVPPFVCVRKIAIIGPWLCARLVMAPMVVV